VRRARVPGNPWSFITALGLSGAWFVGGPSAFFIVATLAILEVSLSFDNAVVNASVLRRLSAFWQRVFLTLGVLIAVFGMRLLFPFVVVGLTAQLGPVEVVNLARQPTEYARRLLRRIRRSPFGGMFLAMIFLTSSWQSGDRLAQPVERLFARFGRVQPLVTIIALAGCSSWPRRSLPTTARLPWVPASSSLATYLAVAAAGSHFSRCGAGSEVALLIGQPPSPLPLPRGPDASFSFDGVVAAFAVTSNIFVIAAGLGDCALYVRSLTVYLVRAGSLNQYVYLEHGALRDRSAGGDALRQHRARGARSSPG
jgi:hypothetical protein